MMTEQTARVIYVRQAVDQMKAAIKDANGTALAEVVNKMARDGYVNEAHELSLLVGVTLIEQLIGQGIDTESVVVLLLGVDDDDE